MAGDGTKKRIKMTPESLDLDNQMDGGTILPDRKCRRRSEPGVNGDEF